MGWLMASHPIVGIVSDCKTEDGRDWLRLPRQYAIPVQKICGAVPLLIPPLIYPQREELISLLDALDGVILSGSPSNVAPEHYQQIWLTPDLPQDHARDHTSLSLIPLILERKIPLLGICRGFQEINVALGGTLHQKVHEVGKYHDHRAPKDENIIVQYETLQHKVRVESGGMLSQLIAEADFWVNSLHGQGVDRLAPDLVVDAYADDGLIEAYRHKKAEGFFLAVQWHPEWRADENPQSRAIFQGFARACHEYANA